MKLKFNAAGLMVMLICLFVSRFSAAQTIDFIEYQRVNTTEPISADFVGEASGEAFVEQWTYSPNADYSGKTVIRINRLRGDETADTPVNTNYYQYDAENWIVLGLDFTLTVSGIPTSIKLNFDPPVTVPRMVEIGQTVQKSGSSVVQFGFVKVKVDFSVSYEFLGLETVETPLGVFENALKVASVKTFAIPGVNETLSTIEWYHPSVGILKAEEPEADSTILIRSIDPPLPTDIADWTLYE
ncbi:MAG: hypothetical protein GC154_10335 [bacterium]|nr:hypothetical protein [bacterium]